MTQMLIAIQARSTSVRFPNKHMEHLGGSLILDHVLKACLGASAYINLTEARYGVQCRVALLTPYGDPLSYAVTARNEQAIPANQCEVFEGPEDDVLTRYHMAADHFAPDYIARVTGDCPMIPNYVISKMLKIARTNEYDYVSNVDPKVRTAIDGVDCEVMSRRLLDWLNEKARTEYHREHVTALVYETMPKWAKLGCVVGYFDHSNQKLSVDTMADLENVRLAEHAVRQKLQIAEARYGKRRVHRL